MTHDFKAALARMNNLRNRMWSNATQSGEEHEIFIDSFEDEIIFALRLADKLMQEPTEGMLLKRDYRVEPFTAVEMFKAMRDQMIKELSAPECKCLDGKDLYGGPYKCECKK